MIATLQSLRFVFVMMIFMSHFAYRDMGAFDAGGDCGVVFFFLLSGFVLSLRYENEIRGGTFQYGKFLKRRFRKLYPLHLLCLSFFLVVSKSGIDLPFLLNIFLLQSWIPDPDIYFSCNSVSWFLSSLFFCYLVFPFAFRRVSVRWVLFVIGAYIVVLLLTPYDKVNAILYVNPLVRFTDFYIGIILCRIYERGYEVPAQKWLELLLIVVLIVVLTIYPYMDAKFRNAPIFWLVLIPFILVFAKGKGVVSKWLCQKPMMMLASLSMPLFMTHQILIGILLHRLPQIPVVAMLFACVLVTLAVSWCIDRYFLRQLEKL